MPVNNTVSVPNQSKFLETTQHTVASQTVQRQVIVVGDDDTNNYLTIGVNGAQVDVRNVVALPLPTGAATEASLGTDGASPPVITGTGIRGWLRAIYEKLLGSIAVTASALPLPTGAATESTLAALNNKNPALVGGRVPVDGSGVTQPVSLAAIPLATNAATEASLAALSAKVPALIGSRIPVGSMDYAYQVGTGVIAGASGVVIRGYNTATSTTNKPIWAEGVASYPVVIAAQTLTVSSSDVNDTSGGAGARTVAIKFIKFSDGAEVTQVFTLAGQTGVQVTLDGYAINEFRVLTAGGSGGNEGVLYIGFGAVTAGVPANILSTIVIGKNNAQQAIYTVPTGKTLDILAFRVYTSKLTYIQFHTRATPASVDVVELDFPLDGDTTFNNAVPLPISAGTQVQCWAQADAGAGHAGIIVSGILR